MVLQTLLPSGSPGGKLKYLTLLLQKYVLPENSRVFLVLKRCKTVADVIRTCLGPKAMLKMILDPMGGILYVYPEYSSIVYRLLMRASYTVSQTMEMRS